MAVIDGELARRSIAPVCEGVTPDAPLIGVPLDFVDINDIAEDSSYSSYPWYAIGKRYCDAVVCSGGVPVMLCYNASNIGKYIDVLDGILVAGSAFDIDPSLYGERERHKTTISRPMRTQFEWAIIKKMMDRDKAILGISGGMQLLNVIDGGTLYQHVPEGLPNALNHTQYKAMTYPHHDVEIFPESILYQEIFQYDEVFATSVSQPASGALRVPVNSYHHQGVKRLGRHFHVVAKTSDGLIEAIESTQLRFCVGVQWNAEFCLTPADWALFRAFIAAAKARV